MERVCRQGTGRGPRVMKNSRLENIPVRPCFIGRPGFRQLYQPTTLNDEENVAQDGSDGKKKGVKPPGLHTFATCGNPA